MNELTIRANISLVELFTCWQNKMHCFLKSQTLNRIERVNNAEILGSFYHPWQIKLIHIYGNSCWSPHWSNGDDPKICMTAHGFKEFSLARSALFWNLQRKSALTNTTLKMFYSEK